MRAETVDARGFSNSFHALLCILVATSSNAMVLFTSQANKFPFVIAACLAWGFLVCTVGSFSMRPSKQQSTKSKWTEPQVPGPSSPLQRRSNEIASSFEIKVFNPWIKNRHVQTIGGYLLRDTCCYLPRQGTVAYLFNAILRSKASKREGNASEFWDFRERIETPDGDWFHADIKKASGAALNAPTVVVCHGLESNSASPVSTGMAKAYANEGMNCVCLNFRGCSGTPNDRLGGYHLGFTDDLKQFLSILKERSGGRVYLSGYSLGGNVVLKCLGELGEDALYKYNVYGAAVLCAPLDQKRNADILASEPIYTSNLLKSLQKRAQNQLELFCDNDASTIRFDYKRAMDASNITEFDDAFIAPIYGFDSAWDYYDKTSAIFFLESIAVPTFILNAKDDPFMNPDVWPVEKTIVGGGRAPIKMARTDYGGHLGYAFHLVDANDERLLDETPAWPATEMATFLGHIEAHPLVD